MLSLNNIYAIQMDVPAMEARHASQLAALQEKLAAAQKQQEAAVGRLQKEQEAERERVKRAIAELKKKLDRHGHCGARSHERGLTQSTVSIMCLMRIRVADSLTFYLQLYCKPWSAMRRHVSGLLSSAYCNAVISGSRGPSRVAQRH